MSAKIHFPTLSLQESLTLGGGITREQAVEAALENMRAISGEGDANIEAAIRALEAIIESVAHGQISVTQLHTVLDQADQVVTMAGTFQYEALDRASRSLCDTADGLLREGRLEVAPLAVHVRAMRLFSPLNGAPQPEVCAHILTELGKVTAHYNFARLDDL